MIKRNLPSRKQFHFMTTRGGHGAHLLRVCAGALLLWTGMAPVTAGEDDGQSLLERQKTRPIVEWPVELDFGYRELAGGFITARELEIWAGNRNLSLLDDHPGRNLQDFEAEVIPPAGLSFGLRAPGQGRAYLYLDLVAYRPLANHELPRVGWLEIIVNGKVLEMQYLGGKAFYSNPVVVTVDREHMPDRTLNVTLRPSPGQGVFAIWDAYVSPYRDDEE